MSAQYDEDIYENPFFAVIQSQFTNVLEKVAANGWIVCVPQFCVAARSKVTLSDVEDHVLVPIKSSKHDPESEESEKYQSLSSKDISFSDGKLHTGKGYTIQQEVQILFEEAFCDDNDKSYRVICIEHFLNALPETEKTEETQPRVRLMNYNQCLDLLWNHTGGTKTRDNVDKVLQTFSSSYESLETEGLRAIADVASTQFTKVMQILLKDSHVKRSARHNLVYMDNLKLAVEMYMMSALHRHLFQVIAAVMAPSDAELNKITRNIAHLQLTDLGVREMFIDNVKAAKKELAKLNSFCTPLGRLLCIKRVTSLLTRSSLSASQSTGSNAMMTTDDFLPILIFLIIKSEIPNWNANLVYMSQFHFAKSVYEDEFAYYLASIEAALEHIKSGKICEEVSGKDKLQGFGWTHGQLDGPSVQRQASGPSHPTVEDFFRYVQAGDEEAVKTMLEKPKKTSEEIYLKLCHPLCGCEKCEKKQAESKTDVNLVTAYTRDCRGYTPLHIAAKCGQAMLIDLLIQHGAVIDATDYMGLTPLLLACQRGFQNVMLLLLHFGANIVSRDNDGNTPLHLCAANGHEDCVKALVFYGNASKKIDVDSVNDVGDTALHLSAKWGYENIVKILLDSEANPVKRNRKKQTPLNLAQNINIQKLLVLASEDYIQRENLEVAPKQQTRVKTVEKSVSVTQLVDGIEEAPVVHVETVNLSPDDAKMQKTKDKLFRVIRDGDIQLVKYYLGFDVEEQDRENKERTENICHPLCQCPKCQSAQMVMSQSSAGLTVNCTTSTFYTPLHLAVLHKHADLVDLFIQRGANVDAKTHKSMTPLHLACCVRSSQNCIKLLESGAKVNVQDVNRDTPLHICSANNFVTGVFSLIEHNACVNMVNKPGNTPLHESTERGYTTIVQHLLDSGARTDIVNKKGLTPPQLAKNKDIKELLKNYAKESKSEKKLTRASSEPTTSSGHVGIKELFSAFEDHNPESLRNLSAAIRTFNRRTNLKQTETQDFSEPQIDSLAHSLSIKHFDKGKLKHVDSFDKTEPMYVYSLSQKGHDDNDVGAAAAGAGGGGGVGSQMKNVLDSTESQVESSGRTGLSCESAGSSSFVCGTDFVNISIDQPLVDVLNMSDSKKHTEEDVLNMSDSKKPTEEDVLNMSDSKKHTEEDVLNMSDSKKPTEEVVLNMSDSKKHTEKDVLNMSDSKKHTDNPDTMNAKNPNSDDSKIKGIIVNASKSDTSQGSSTDTSSYFTADTSVHESASLPTDNVSQSDVIKSLDMKMCEGNLKLKSDNSETVVENVSVVSSDTVSTEDDSLSFSEGAPSLCKKSTKECENDPEPRADNSNDDSDRIVS